MAGWSKPSQSSLARPSPCSFDWGSHPVIGRIGQLAFVAVTKPSLEHAVIAALGVGGMVAVAAPMSDNSMFVHLRTGLDMVTTGAIPRTDPYSFTAPGHDWIVQSWFAEALYGLMQELLSENFVIVFHVLLAGATALLIALLARANTMPRTLAAGIPSIALAWFTWTQRPLLFGLLGFAILIYVTIRRRSAWWLLPVAWVWVNSHGSWPIGIAWLVAFGLGERIDRGVFDKRTLKYGGYFTGGVLLGAINPLGPKILIFFTSAFGDRAKSFAAIVEWGSPSFHSASGFVTGVAIVAVLIAGFRTVVPWRHALPVLGLLLAALYSSRNLALLSVAIAPMMGNALSAGKQVTAQSKRDERIAACAMSVVVIVGLMIVVRSLVQDPFETKEYPVAAIDRMDAMGLLSADHNVLSRETAGCYRIWRDGRQARVFMDDRIDMYPAAVSKDYLHLFGGDTDPMPILDKYQIDVVLWEEDRPLSQILKRDSAWREAFTEKGHAVFTREKARPGL